MIIISKEKTQFLVKSGLHVCQYLLMVFEVFCSSPCQSSFPRTLKQNIKLNKFEKEKKKHNPELKLISKSQKSYVNTDVKFHKRNWVSLRTRGPWTRTYPGKGSFSLLNNLRAVEDTSTDSPTKRKACKS